jgi:ferritin-like metal-binding protein YciE
MEALQKLLTHELSDLYDAEQQIVKALPKLIQNASSSELQEALQEHLAVTQKQIERLDEVFSALGEKREQKKCKGMAGLIAEGEDLISEDFEESTQDAGIIGAAQRVEHYEIAAYGTARTLAQTLGNSEVADLLEESLEEEKEADERLTQIAESAVNAEAASEEDEEEGSSGNGGRSRATAGASSRGSASGSGSRSSGSRSSKSRNTRTRSRTKSKAGR